MPIQYSYKPYITPTPTIKGDRLIGEALLRHAAMESKRVHELKSLSPKKLHKRLAKHRVERLRKLFQVQVRQFTLTAASVQQLQVWIRETVAGVSYSREVQEFEQYLTGMMLAEVEGIIAEADPVWPLVRTGKEIENLP